MFSDEFFQNLIIFFPIFLFSLTIHEVAHALTANWGGDLTATYENRLSLNPMVHIDPLGTIIVPIVSSASGVPLFGWAKPVPVNEQQFRDKFWNVVVAFAGPFSNFLIVLFATSIYSLLIRVIDVGYERQWFDVPPNVLSVLHNLFARLIIINWVLALFNLMPIPPLDGSHIFHHFFIRGRGNLYAIWDTYARFGIWIFWIIVAFTPAGSLIGRAAVGMTRLSFRVLGVPGAW